MIFGITGTAATCIYHFFKCANNALYELIPFLTPASMDTYARLLYKTGNRQEAIFQESKAVEAGEKSGCSNKELESILINMKKYLS